MTYFKIFNFNAFQVNTFVLYDETKDCIIIDPGCSNLNENNQLTDFINNNKLKPLFVIVTHSHIDHILGISYILSKYDNLIYYIHKSDIEIFNNSEIFSKGFGFNFKKPIKNPILISENLEIRFGNTKLEIIFTPGHSPGSICLYDKKNNFIIAGDVLFRNSIGRTDLPGGNYDTLLHSIKSKLFCLPDDCIVYPGHGPETNIGFEKRNNSFLQ